MSIRTADSYDTPDGFTVSIVEVAPDGIDRDTDVDTYVTHDLRCRACGWVSYHVDEDYIGDEIEIHLAECDAPDAPPATTRGMGVVFGGLMVAAVAAGFVLASAFRPAAPVPESCPAVPVEVTPETTTTGTLPGVTP